MRDFCMTFSATCSEKCNVAKFPKLVSISSQLHLISIQVCALQSKRIYTTHREYRIVL